MVAGPGPVERIGVDRLEELVDQVVRRGAWTRLPPALAAACRAERNRGERTFWRSTLLMGIVACNGYTLTDRILLPDVVPTLVLLRLGVLTPLALLFFVVLRISLRRAPSSSIALWWLGGTGVALVVVQSYLAAASSAATVVTFFHGTYLVSAFFAVVLRSSLLVASVTQGAIWVAFTVGAGQLDAPVRQAPLYDSLVMACFGAVGVLVAYRVEQRTRDRFVAGCAAYVAQHRREEVVQQLAATRDQLARQAGQDPLTGLPNRRGLAGTVQTWHEQGIGAGLGLLVVDLDHFKAYNDRYGHVAGDACLREVAAAMTGAIDPDGVDRALARFGGEEFVVVLRDVTPDAATATAEHLRAAVDPRQGSPDVAGSRVGRSLARSVTVSVGVAWSADGDVDRLMQAADAALYVAKADGRNTVADARLPRVAADVEYA